MSALPFHHDTESAATMAGAEGIQCRVHRWSRPVEPTEPIVCLRCGKDRDEAAAKRGRTNRTRGNRAELLAARRYGGTKIGPLGGPADIIGRDFATQVKSHQRLAPAEWRKAFAALAQDRRIPRLLLRFTQPGVPADDYFVFRSQDFLDWFGRDEA